MTGCAAWSGRTRSSERGVLGETANLEQPHPPGIEHERPVQEAGVSAETPAAGQALAPTSSSLADALLIIAEAFLAGKVAAADDPEVYQVIVHVGTDTLTPAAPPAQAGDVSAETRGWTWTTPSTYASPTPPTRPASPTADYRRPRKISRNRQVITSRRGPGTGRSSRKTGCPASAGHTRPVDDGT
jgi:hypothetical protein